MYQVRWHAAPRDALARAWLESDSTIRKLINGAANEIDRILGSDPWNAGESRSHGRRILFVLPLGVIFRVERDQMMVSILELWSVRPRKK